MSNHNQELKRVNDDLNTLTKELIKQLELFGVEQTDLNYFIAVKNNLLMLKSQLELQIILE